MLSAISDTQYQQYFNALLQGDGAQCKTIVQSLLSQEIHFLDLYEQLFRRSLYETGELWAKGLISVADEHIATAITENLISQLQPTLRGFNKSRGRVVISNVTSDLHQIGGKMVANYFEVMGWETYFLGANMPLTDLLGAIDRLIPDVICLSLSLIEHVKILEVTIREIQSTHPKTPIIAGGRAFLNSDPGYHNLGHIQNVHILQSVIQLEQFISSFEL
jgi:MerR family transcriptional regulator, light-induced transcriptional regulator